MTSRSTVLPRVRTTGRRAGRALLGLLATIALLALLVGVPYGLAHWIGWPLPKHWPSSSKVKTTLASPVSDRLLLDVLACACWLLWAAFAFDVLRAAPDAARDAQHSAGSPARSGHAIIRAHKSAHSGPLQSVAVVLLAAIFAGLLSLRPHAALAAPATAAPDDHASGAAARSATAVLSTRRGVPTTPSATHDLHEVVARTVTVQPPHDGSYDSLWRIAQRTLGDGERWRELYQLNKGLPQPDGQSLQQPSLVRPGWVLRLPAAQTTHPTRPAPHSSPHTTPPTSAPAPPSPTAPARPAAPSTAPPNGPAPSRTPKAESHASDADAWELPALAAGGAVLAAFCAAALTRRRRQQWRHRRPGRSIALPSSSTPNLVPLDRALRQAGARTDATDLSWIDHALRHLAAAALPAAPPDVTAARLDGTTLELVLHSPASNPPPPWTTNATGDRWRLDLASTGKPTNPNAEEPVSVWAPYPTLVAIGDELDNGAMQHWLLDLERVSPLVLTGDANRCRDLARFVAAELAHNPWSDHLQTTLVGFGSELVDLNPERITHTDDLDGVLTQLRAQLTTTDAVDVLGSRVNGLEADAPTPHVIITAPRGGEPDTSVAAAIADLSEAGRVRDQRRLPVALIVCDISADAVPASVGLRVRLGGDGTAVLDAPLNLSLTAHQLPADQAQDLAALFALADNLADQPQPSARGDRSWEQHTDAVGAPLSADRTTITETSSGSDTDGEGAAVLVDGAADRSQDQIERRPPLTLPDSAYLTHGATTAADLRMLAPRLSAQRRDQLRAADPDLDNDLAVWKDPHSAVPKVHLLGPLGISGVPEPPAKRAALLIELVAYLATHPRGVTVETLANDLWPHIPDAATKTTPRQSVSLARQWLGSDPTTGHERLPRAATDRAGSKLYRLDGVLVDADLFRRLRTRAHAAGDGQTDLLWEALGLVTGPPFSKRRPAGYGWLSELPLDHEYTAMIIDVAHLVATDALAHDDPERAARAAQVALDAGAVDDIALLDLAAACEARGEHGQTKALVRRVLTNHDAEIFEDLPPRTYEILRRRNWITT